jgi:hypothetical protein
MMKTLGSSVTSVLTRGIRRNVPEDAILHSHPVDEALGFSETSVITRVTQHNIPGDDILHSDRLEILKSYIVNISSHL